MTYTKQELLQRRSKISQRILNHGRDVYNIAYNYTGVGDSLGSSDIENSPGAAFQFEMALAMSKHSLVDKLIEDESINFYNFDPKPLIENKVLTGIKILDMGCGHQPTFARVSRYMGADVYTIDLFPASTFHESKEYPLARDIKELEIKNHIQQDLDRKDTIETIRKISGGEFDLVTEAHLDTMGFYDGKIIALPLLKQGGIHYNPLASFDLAIKEGNELK